MDHLQGRYIKQSRLKKFARERYFSQIRRYIKQSRLMKLRSPEKKIFFSNLQGRYIKQSRLMKIRSPEQ